MFFKKNQNDKKAQRLNQIWNDALESVSQNIEKEAFTLASEIINSDNSNKEVKWKLAVCYRFGIGCDENSSIAKKLFLETVDDDKYSWIYKLLGNISYDNKDSDAAIYYSKYLENHNDDKEAIVFLADCYRNGIGVEKDINKTLELYQSVANTEYSENVDFQNRFGLFLAEIKSDEGLLWLKKATEQKSACSAYELADQFLNADYLPLDPYTPTFRINRAIYYLKVAIELGKDENGFTEEGYIAINKYNVLMAELGLQQNKGE